MSELEFLVMAIAEWETLLLLEFAAALLLYLGIRRSLVGGVFDPMVLALVLGYSVNYAVVGFLYLHGAISTYMAFMVFAYGITLIYVFRKVSRVHRQTVLLRVVQTITPRSCGRAAYSSALLIYLGLSGYIIYSIGFGIFAETNRFDVGRGFGAYIRLLDFLGPFIVSYSVLHIFSAERRSRVKLLALVLFILFSAMVNGAKISVIFSLFTAVFTLAVARIRLKIRPITAAAFLVVGLGFSVLALSINLERNSVDESGAPTNLAGAGLVVEKFVYRVIAGGDTSYLLLPNDVIDKIETDSVAVRFLVPFIGVSGGTQLFGYPVGDYSVGRQALLYYDDSNDVAGGPTSHFDLFSYVYFGLAGGWLFVCLLAYILGVVNRAVHATARGPEQQLNKFRVALLATLWSRAVLLIVEPTVALAYIFDVFVFFAALSLAIQAVAAPRRGAIALSAGDVRPVS